MVFLGIVFRLKYSKELLTIMLKIQKLTLWIIRVTMGHGWPSYQKKLRNARIGECWNQDANALIMHEKQNRSQIYALYQQSQYSTFLLVSSSVSSKKLLCFVHGQGQKKRTKTIQQMTLSSFITIPSINYVRRKSSSFHAVRSAISWAATHADNVFSFRCLIRLLGISFPLG